MHHHFYLSTEECSDIFDCIQVYLDHYYDTNPNRREDLYQQLQALQDRIAERVTLDEERGGWQ